MPMTVVDKQITLGELVLYRTRGVDHPDVRQKIQEIVNTLVQK
jgi:hypothetical protein